MTGQERIEIVKRAFDLDTDDQAREVLEYAATLFHTKYDSDKNNPYAR